jgi:hypothetical protein
MNANAQAGMEVHGMSEWVKHGEYIPLPTDDPDVLATTQVWIFLSIAGQNVDPDALTTLTGIQPQRSEVRGEYSERLRRHRETSIWEIALRLEGDDRIDTEIQRMLAILEPHRGFLQLMIDSQMIVDVHVILGKIPQWVHGLSPQTLEKIAVLGAQLIFEVTNASVY